MELLPQEFELLNGFLSQVIQRLSSYQWFYRLSDDQMAEYIGIQRSTFIRFMSGKFVPNLKLVIKMLSLCSCSAYVSEFTED